MSHDFQFKPQALSVLIVDDHIPIRKAIRRVLVGLNFSKIQEVSDGAEAIKVLQARPIDFIICDLYMRKIDGFEVIRHLRDREVGSDVPIIVVTGEASKEDIVKAVDMGTDDYLLKPFHAEDLEKKVVSVLNKYHSPGPLLNFVRQAERLLFEHNYVEAMTIIDEALKLDPGSMRARHAKALALDKLGQSDKAISLLLENIKLNASYYKNYGTLGDILMRQGRKARAIEAIRKELHLNPKNPNRQVQLAKLLLASHDTEGAAYHFREALKENSKHPTALIGMGRAYALQDNLEKALYYFKRLRRYHPNASKALEAITKYAIDAGEPKKAELILRDERNSFPERLDTYIALAKLYAATDRKNEALAILDELVIKKPDFLPGIKFRGELLAHYGMFHEAISAFIAVLKLDADPKILMKLAETYLAVQKYSEAIDAYHRSFQARQDQASVFFGLGLAYMHTKQITKAYLSFSHAVRLGLENPHLIAYRSRCEKIIKARHSGNSEIAS